MLQTRARPRTQACSALAHLSSTVGCFRPVAPRALAPIHPSLTFQTLALPRCRALAVFCSGTSDRPIVDRVHVRKDALVSNRHSRARTGIPLEKRLGALLPSKRGEK